MAGAATMRNNYVTSQLGSPGFDLVIDPVEILKQCCNKTA